MRKATYEREVERHLTLSQIASCEELKEYHKFFVYGISMLYFGAQYPDYNKHSFRVVLASSEDPINRFRGCGYLDGYRYDEVGVKRGNGGIGSKMLNVRIHDKVIEWFEEKAQERSVSLSSIIRIALTEFIIKNCKEKDKLLFSDLKKDLINILK